MWQATQPLPGIALPKGASCQRQIRPDRWLACNKTPPRPSTHPSLFLGPASASANLMPLHILHATHTQCRRGLWGCKGRTHGSLQQHQAARGYLAVHPDCCQAGCFGSTKRATHSSLATRPPDHPPDPTLTFDFTFLTHLSTVRAGEDGTEELQLDPSVDHATVCPSPESKAEGL
mmetsp:Transcript_70141/g.123632  ORF Transcript_70141/g.123632 Transcript_70141/m.123632 type:complete len:175 (-) Transcript_70141:298-822(-)